MFVIVCDSQKDSLPLGLTDRALSKLSWWTRDISLVKRFDNENGARRVIASLKLNNPRVATFAWLKLKLTGE